jgi:hypothetical protein
MIILIRLLVAIILVFASIITIMNLCHGLNKGNVIYNIASLIGLVMLFYVIVKTKVFTKFKK